MKSNIVTNQDDTIFNLFKIEWINTTKQLWMQYELNSRILLCIYIEVIIIQCLKWRKMSCKCFALSVLWYSLSTDSFFIFDSKPIIGIHFVGFILAKNNNFLLLFLTGFWWQPNRMAFFCFAIMWWEIAEFYPSLPRIMSITSTLTTKKMELKSVLHD